MKAFFDVTGSGDVVVIVLNREAAVRLVDVLEDSVRELAAVGEQLDPLVYALGERVSKRVDKDSFFGVPGGLKQAS